MGRSIKLVSSIVFHSFKNRGLKEKKDGLKNYWKRKQIKLKKLKKQRSKERKDELKKLLKTQINKVKEPKKQRLKERKDELKKYWKQFVVLVTSKPTIRSKSTPPPLNVRPSFPTFIVNNSGHLYCNLLWKNYSLFLQVAASFISDLFNLLIYWDLVLSISI